MLELKHHQPSRIFIELLSENNSDIQWNFHVIKHFINLADLSEYIGNTELHRIKSELIKLKCGLICVSDLNNDRINICVKCPKKTICKKTLKTLKDLYRTICIDIIEYAKLENFSVL